MWRVLWFIWNTQIINSSSPFRIQVDLVPPPPVNSKLPGVTTSLLYSGSKFRGHQKSKGNSYDVEVVLQNVDEENSYLCGYLKVWFFGRWVFVCIWMIFQSFFNALLFTLCCFGDFILETAEWRHSFQQYLWLWCYNNYISGFYVVVESFVCHENFLFHYHFQGVRVASLRLVTDST